MLNKSEELVAGFSILILSSGHSYSDSSGEVSDTIAPDELVQSLVNSDIISEHVLLGESNDFLEGSGGLFLEADFMASLVEINSVISGDGSEGLLFSVLLRHLE